MPVKVIRNLMHLKKPDAPNVVLFNLASIDIPQMLIQENVMASLGEWAERAEMNVSDDEALGDVNLVICHAYNWKAPFRDPFDT